MLDAKANKQRDARFFQAVTTAIFKGGAEPNLHWIVVSHIVEDTTAFIEALSGIGTVTSVIPKPNSIDGAVLKRLKARGYPIHNVGRDGVKDAGFLEWLFKNEGRYVIVDIGGYFAYEQLPRFTHGRLAGIIECTENGHQKYEQLPEGSLTFPVFSIARSPLKECEDDLIGHSIGFYAEMILRQKYISPRFLKTGILGYGKVGRGIASYLFGQHVKPLVFDTSPIKMTYAYKDGCLPVARENVLGKCDLIFCATGAKGIATSDFKSLKNGCFLAAVTSPDDEFDLSQDHNYTFFPLKDNIQKIAGPRKNVFLLNGGNAINFVVPGDRVGSFIRPIQGEVIAASYHLLRRQPGMNERSFLRYVPTQEREKIASIFLKEYAG